MASRDNDELHRLRMSATETNRLTPLDWGAAGFFKRVSDVVEKQITEWMIALDHWSLKVEEHGAGSLGSDERAYLHNLFAAWAEAESRRTKKGHLREFDQILSALNPMELPSGRAISQLADRIEAHRDLAVDLFNSYYYVAVDRYGEEGEYYFIPLALPLPGAAGPLEVRFKEWLGTADPTRNIGNRRYQYRTTILPARGGITPQICRLAIKSQSRSHYEEVPETVDWFLADVAIIGKTEDHATRSRSAIIGPLIDRTGVVPVCEGAFVLTCAVPSAFSLPNIRLGPLRRRTAKQQFTRLIEDWASGPLTELHRDLTREGWEPACRVEWSALERFGIEDTPLRHALSRDLLERGRHGIVALAGCQRIRGEDVTFAVMDHDALGHSLRTILIPGPGMLPRLVSESGDNNDNVVDPDRMRGHLLRLEAVSNPAAPPSDCDDLVHRTLGPLLPGSTRVPPSEDAVGNGSSAAQDEALRITLKAQQGAVRIVAVLEPHAEVPDIERKLALLADLLRQGHENRPPLPDETSPFFSLLQQFWTEHHDLNLNVTAGVNIGTEEYADIEEPYKQFRALVLRSDVLAVFVFLSKTRFVPEDITFEAGLSGAASASEFRKMYLSYPSYWVFENVCRFMTCDNVPLRRFKGELKRGARFWAHDTSGFPKVIVRENAAEVDRNQAWRSALEYFGIPVEEWHTEDYTTDTTDALVVDVPSANDETDLIKCAREFLLKHLSNGISLRLMDLPGAGGDSRPSSRWQIDIDVHGEGGASTVTHHVRFKASDGREQICTTLWTPVDTAELVLFGIDPAVAMPRLTETVRRGQYTEWNTRAGQHVAPLSPAVGAALEKLESSLVRQQDIDRERIRSQKRHEHSNIPHLLEMSATHATELSEIAERAGSYSTIVPPERQNTVREQWKRDVEFIKKVRRMQPHIKYHALLYRLAVLDAPSSEEFSEFKMRNDPFKGENISAADAVRETFKSSIYGGVWAAAEVLYQKNYALSGEFPGDYFDWYTLVYDQMLEKLRLEDLGGIMFPQCDKLEGAMRWRAILTLHTCFENMVKHHLIQMITCGVPEGTIRREDLSAADIQVASDAFDVYCDRTTLNIRNFGGLEKSGDLKAPRVGTFQDITNWLSRAPYTGEVLRWEFLNEKPYSKFLTDLLLGDYFWGGAPNGHTTLRG